MKYYIKKIIRSYKEKTLFLKINFYFKNLISLPFYIIFLTIKNFKNIKNLKIKIIKNSSSYYEKNNLIIKKITESYHVTKKINLKSDSPFILKGLWAEWIEINFKNLINCLNRRDNLELFKLLDNMFQETFTRGFSVYDGFIRLKRPFGRLYYLSVWQEYFKKYLKEKYNTKLINFPEVGNPSGVILNDQVIPFETIRHCYFANQFKELLKGEENPLVVEIGGGFGGFAQQFLSKFNDEKIRYILYDLPEVNVISSYFLMKSFPNKKFLLFNNQDPWEGSIDFDIAILPYFEITKIPENSVDLFYNACSFSEMSSDNARAYLNQIEISCKNYFAHENHEVRFTYSQNGEKSANLLGSEIIPSIKKFKRIYKKKRVFGLPEDFYYKSNEYLYQKYF